MRRYTGEWYTLGASFLWATSFVAVKVGLEGWDPLWFLFWRILVAALLLLPLFWHRLRWRDYIGAPAVWGLGFFCALGYIFQYIGMVETTASAAAFLINFGIVFVALFSYLLLKEPFDPVKILGILLAVVGAFLLTTGMSFSGLSETSLRGNILVLLGGLFWAVYTVGNKWVLQHKEVRVVPLTALVLLIAAVWIFPPALMWGNQPEAPGVQEILIIGYMIVFCTAAPFVLWTHGLRKVQPTVSAAILLMEPVFATLLAYALLGERFSTVEFTGAAMIFLAIVMVSLGNQLLPRRVWNRG